MTTIEFEATYWSYYLTLERGVESTEPYVTFHPDNYQCFSNEYIKIFQAICSEIDVICKQYCDFIIGSPLSKNEANIRVYARTILEHRKKIAEQSVRILRYDNDDLTPWKDWTEHSPEWWDKYNAVKHRRSDVDICGKKNYQAANLANVLNSLAGLYLLERYFHNDLSNKELPPGKVPFATLKPRSGLFSGYGNDNLYEILNPLHI